jgi:hypothetical protein
MIHSWLTRVSATRAQNVGLEVGSWPLRMEAAWKLFREVLPEGNQGYEVADFGCGRQELRALLPSGWTYVPYDWTPRSADTRICDLQRELPEGTQDVIFMLGVLEYLPDPARLLTHALTQARWTVFSCFCGWSPWRAWKQGWRGQLSKRGVQQVLRETGVQVRAYRDWRGDGGLWVCENTSFSKGGPRA